MKHHDPVRSFLFTIPALTILACDPTDSEPGEDSTTHEAERALDVADPQAAARGDDEDPPLTPAEEAAEAEADEARLDGPDGVFLDPALRPVVGKPPSPGPDKDLLVAMVGDMGSGSKPKAVYQLILDEQADFALITGDFDYKDSPSTFQKEMNAVLGADYPAFPVIGNHDKSKWSQYQADFKARLAKTPGAVCTGDLGVDASCTYRGLHFVLSGVGTIGSKAKHEDYIACLLYTSPSPRD